MAPGLVPPASAFSTERCAYRASSDPDHRVEPSVPVGFDLAEDQRARAGCQTVPAGAIVGALYASGVNIDEMLDIIKNFKKKDFWEGNFFHHAMKPFRGGFKNGT